MPSAPAPRSSEIGTSAAQQCATVAASPAAAKTHSSASEAAGGPTARCRPKPDAVGTWAASTNGRAGSSTWSTSSAAGHASLHVGEVDADTFGERLGELAAGAVVS